MTLNGVMAVILSYFSEFVYLPGELRKSSRSLSHLLVSSCSELAPRLPMIPTTELSSVKKRHRGNLPRSKTILENIRNVHAPVKFTSVYSNQRLYSPLPESR